MRTKFSIRQGWKVFERKGRTLTSLSGDIPYREGPWEYPQKGWGPICVFREYCDASAFRGFDQVIRPCLYVPAKVRKMWIRGERPQSSGIEGKDYASAVWILPENCRLDHTRFPRRPRTKKGR